MLILKQQERHGIFVGGVCPPESCPLLLRQCRLQSCSQSCADAEEWGIGVDAREKVNPAPAAVARKSKTTALDLHSVSGLLLLCIERCFELRLLWETCPLRHSPWHWKASHIPVWYPHCCVEPLSHSHCYIRAFSSLRERWKIESWSSNTAAQLMPDFDISIWKSQSALPGSPVQVKPGFNWQQNSSSVLLLVLWLMMFI